MHPLADGPVRYALDQSWCDANGFFVAGRVHAGSQTVRRLTVRAGESRYDVLRLPPAGEDAPDRRFALYMTWRAGDPISLEVETDGGVWTGDVRLPRSEESWRRPFCLTDGSADLPEPPPDHDADALVEFLTEVRRRGAAAPGQRVAEVGARAVSANWATMRPWFDGLAEYVGIDIHPGHGVDLVGDAHYLHEMVGPGALDAVFSMSVMEHLAYPWLFASSVNRALRVGGLTFHATHHAWPLHELPNDYWRFSEAAMRLLFGSATGFEVVRAGYRDRMHIQPERLRPADAMMALQDGWGGVWVYARKVAEIPDGAVAWPTDAERSRDVANMYPAHRG